MPVAHAHTDFDSWSVEGHSLRIEYAVPVLEEICADAVHGLYRFRHGGVEIGGVLFGEADADTVRILAYRPLLCEHAFGPRFVLSDRDRANFKDLLYAGRTDVALQGLAPVGWYHSHTRSAIELSPRDLEIYDSYFPQRWQIALVVRPDHYGPARAGFFFRERDNAIRTAKSYEEFVIHPRRHGPSRAPAGPEPETQPAAPAAPDGPESDSGPPTAVAEQRSAASDTLAPDPALPWVLDSETPAPVEAQRDPELPSFARQEPMGVRKWLWPMVLIALLAATGFGVERYYRSSGPPQPLSLWVADMGGQLLIEWDRTARPIRDATSGALEITDGKDRVDIEIEGARLREGSVDYVRRSEVVDVRLRVHQRGRSTEEVIRFVGQPVRRPPTPDMAEVLKQNETLKAEVAGLRAQVEQLQRRRARSMGAGAGVPRP